MEHRRAPRRAASRTLGTEPAVWIGHSFGGRLAFELAARRPELVERLVLLDPAILIDPEIALHVAENGPSRPIVCVVRRGRRPALRRERALDARRGSVVAADLRRLPRRGRRRPLALPLQPGGGRRRLRRDERQRRPPFDDSPHPDAARPRGGLVRPYDHLLDAHREALGDLLEVVTVPGGHTVLWDALEETATAIAAFLAAAEPRPRRRPRAVLGPSVRRTRRRSRGRRRGSRRPPRPPRG